MGTRRIRLVIIGLGNVGRNVLSLLVQKREALKTTYGLDPIVVGVADTSGAAHWQQGLDLSAIIALKRHKQGVALYPRHGYAGVAAQELVRQTQADVLIEASPANLTNGQPGLGCIREALERGWHVVTADKAPLVLAYRELMSLAQKQRRQLRFSGTVGGGLPSVNVGRRDLAACTIHRVEAILNSTTHYILTAMLEEGKTFDEALAEAQRSGVAEADPSLDVDGWDAASKCVILANSVLGYPATLKDVAVTGIRDVTIEEMHEAKHRGQCLKLLVTAERGEDGYRLAVRPTPIPQTHPLAPLRNEELGIVYYTDIMGAVTVAIAEKGPVPTAAAVLRDVIAIYRGSRL